MSALLLWAALAVLQPQDCADVLTWASGCPRYVLGLGACEQAALRICHGIRGDAP